MPGPPKQSNAHKKKTGSRKMHPGEDLAPPLIDRVPDVPAFLKGKHYAVNEWRRVCKLLIAEQILTRWDYTTITVLCSEWQRYCDACDDIDKNGEVMTTKTGYEQVRPASTIRNKAFGHYEKMLLRVGGDIVSRSKMKRIKPAKAEKKNSFGGI